MVYLKYSRRKIQDCFVWNWLKIGPTPIVWTVSGVVCTEMATIFDVGRSAVAFFSQQGTTTRLQNRMRSGTRNQWRSLHNSYLLRTLLGDHIWLMSRCRWSWVAYKLYHVATFLSAISRQLAYSVCLSIGPVQLGSYMDTSRYLLDRMQSALGLKCRRSARLLALGVRTHDCIASGTASITRPGRNPKYDS